MEVRSIVPKVSIIIPVYNKEEYLDRCLNSILNQTLSDIEIILINDGSVDNSLKICNKYALHEARIKVINQKNAGVSAARNSGLLIATGEYITFVDPDDWVEQNMYLSMYESNIKASSDVCMCNYIKEIGSQEIKVELVSNNKILYKEEITNEIILNLIGPATIDSNNSFIMGNVWRLLIKKDLIDRYHIRFPHEISLMEDLIFCLIVFSNTNKVCIDQKFHYHYCTQQDSATLVYRNNKHKLQLNAISLIEQFLVKENLLEVTNDRMKNRYINLGISSIINETHKDNPSNIINKISNINDICSDLKIKNALLSIDTNKLTLRKRMVLEAMKRRKSLLLYVYYKLVNAILFPS